MLHTVLTTQLLGNYCDSSQILRFPLLNFCLRGKFLADTGRKITSSLYLVSKNVPGISHSDGFFKRLFEGLNVDTLFGIGCHSLFMNATFVVNTVLV